MVITDEMDAMLLRQMGSDENSWQMVDRAKKKKQMTKSWPHEDTDRLQEMGME